MNNDDLCIYMSKNLKNTNIDYYIRIGGTMNVGKKLCSRG